MKQTPVALSPHERIALLVLSKACGITNPEVLRLGLRLLWRLHRKGKLHIDPSPLFNLAASNKTPRYKRYNRKKPSL